MLVLLDLFFFVAYSRASEILFGVTQRVIEKMADWGP